VQDTAYESLLKSRRHILHQKIAETLREKFVDVVEAEPELIAHHFTQARLIEAAIEYWGRAGDLALRRSAFKEAIAHLNKAIDLTEALAKAGEKKESNGKLKLQVLYATAHLHAAGPGANRRVLESSGTRGCQRGRSRAAVSLLWLVGQSFRTRGSYTGAGSDRIHAS
jgi:predicted ATPase